MRKHACNYLNKIAAAPPPTKEQWAAMTPWQREKYTLGTWGAIGNRFAQWTDAGLTGVLRGAETIGLPAFSKGVVKGIVNLPGGLTALGGMLVNGFGLWQNSVGDAMINAGDAITLEDKTLDNLGFAQTGDKSYITDQRVVDHINNTMNFAGEIVGSTAATAGIGSGIGALSKGAGTATQVANAAAKTGQVTNAVAKTTQTANAAANVADKGGKIAKGIKTAGKVVGKSAVPVGTTASYGVSAAGVENKHNMIAGKVADPRMLDPNFYAKNMKQFLRS